MNNLKEIRESQKIYQKNVAKALKIGVSTYSQWENGINEPSIGALTALADFFGCSVDYLVGRESEDFQIISAGNKLSKDENGLIDNLRALSPLRKEVVYRVVGALTEEQAAENK